MPRPSLHHKKSRKKSERPTSESRFPFLGAIKLLNKENQKAMIEKLKSRKLWMLVLTSVLTALGDALGLSDIAQIVVAIIGGSYFTGQGIADSGAQGFITDLKTKLFSRKLWVSLISIVVTVVGDYMGLGEVSAWIVGAISSSFNIGQGVADSQLISLRSQQEEDFGD